ncbi:ankyrin and armadillo repeat-containing protein [Amblyraja radiata]|uniref:ankyrin and armadillo repeat-containing protein n=1 Tax=Amblyraja radiata TaxID=386614 RepID=UPI001403D72E|nr:ankyrin and armadillo repeat-containing protein [Amblyraja radiata]
MEEVYRKQKHGNRASSKLKASIKIQKENLAAQMNLNTSLSKYNLSDQQELLATATCSWLQPTEEFQYPVELPSGLSSQMKDFKYPNAVILAPVVQDAPFNYKEFQQILRELVMGIYVMNQIPSIYIDGNHDCSSSCLLSPAYDDTLTGQILINVDYTMKALWHGAYMSKEKRMRFSEIWRSHVNMGIDGTPKAEEKTLTEFIKAGLIDISFDPDFEGIYSEVYNDPTYDPNDCSEMELFMKYVNNILLQINPYLISVKQHQNMFTYDADYILSNAVRLTEEEIDLVNYQRLQQRLILHQKLVEKFLTRKAQIHRDITYLKLIAFLVPLLIAMKRERKIPVLSRLLPPFSDEKLKTEREFPPLLLGASFKCKHFQYQTSECFHLHGGIEFDIGTPEIEDMPYTIKVAFDDIYSQAMHHLKQLFNPDMILRGQHTIPIMQFDDQSYYVICIELENLHQKTQKFQWWRNMSETVHQLKSSKLPLNEDQIAEQLKKKYGIRKAARCKNLPFSLISVTDSGLAAVFYSFSQLNPMSHLGVEDQNGYGLFHHAAMHNHVSIMCLLTTIRLKINQHRNHKFQDAGQTALHMAAKCGSLGALNCLLGLRADHATTDARGWTAMHFAAFYDNVSCVRALHRKDPKLLELETSARYRATPLLLTAMAGAFDTLQYLLSLGADILKVDNEANNIVHLAALYFHTDILMFIIEQRIPELRVWNLLKEMMQSKDYHKQEMGVRSLEVLSVIKRRYWKEILDAGSIPPLIDLLNSNQETLQCIAAAVLCNLSFHLPACESVIDFGIIPGLISLLYSNKPELQSRCSVILFDIAQVKNNASLIATLGAIPPLVQILNSVVEDVLVNAIKFIQMLCINNPINQTLVVKEGAIPLLVELLSGRSEVLKGYSSLALAEIARGHSVNQDVIAAEGAIPPLVKILSGRKIKMQLKAIAAVEVLADRNAATQKEFLELSADKHILKLLKVFEIEIREQAATAIWALAGQTLTQRKHMAKDIGYNLIIDLLLSSSDKMHYVACQAMIALSECSKEQQNKICTENGLPPLIRLLRSSRISLRTLLSGITVLGTMCVGVAHKNNPFSQNKITEEGGVDVLLHLLAVSRSHQVQVEVIYNLACIVLGNKELQKLLKEKQALNYKTVLKHLKYDDKEGVLRAGGALALFAFNNPKQQQLIREAGGIHMSVYQNFLHSKNEVDQANAAFQVIILAKVIADVDEVTLTATGIVTLVNLLKSNQPSTIIVVGQLMSCLTQTRAGITDAMITMGAVESLCPHLSAERDEVRESCATALGYLSFNRTAHRHLLVECRNQPDLYDLLISNVSPDGKICQEFIDEFNVQKLIGLPQERKSKNRNMSTRKDENFAFKKKNGSTIK